MYRTRGFTLIEVMVVVAIIAILASIAVPSYSRYMFRAKVPEGLDALMTVAGRMEQRYQDVGNYGTDETCAVADYATKYFAVTCALDEDTQGFTATATGTGPMAGVAYTIDHTGARNTTAHPYGKPASACWSTAGGSCDT